MADDENREPGSAGNSEKAVGEEGGTKSPDSSAKNGDKAVMADDENREPGSAGNTKNGDKAAGMLQRTKDEFMGFIHHGGGGFLFGRSDDTLERTKPKEVTLEDIWIDTVDEAFAEIATTIGKGGTVFIGLDTEFCRKDGVLDPRGAPTSEQLHYDQVCRTVNGGDLLQVGLVLANELLETEPAKIFQFNLLFDQSKRSSDSENLRFIREVARLDLNAHANRGITLTRFFSLLVGCRLIGNNRLIWITYQGHSDFGYLIRGIEEVDVLHKSRTAFLDTVQSYFPRSYDLKILHELGIYCKAPPPMPRPKGTGGFQAMANGLSVERIGEAHGAGSDAHLALSCYKRMVLSSPPAAALISRFRDAVYGVAGASTIPWEDSNAMEVKVSNCNFDTEARLFSELSCRYYPQQVVSVEVSFVTGGHCNNTISYSMIRGEAALSGPVEIGFAVSDMGGNLPFGRIWHFSVGNGNDCIELSRFAKMLSDDEVVLNPDAFWCSSSSTAFIYLVKALSRSDSLPLKRAGFFALAAAYFPNLRVLNTGMMLSENRPSRRALSTLRQLQLQLQMRVSQPGEVWLWFPDLTE